MHAARFLWDALRVNWASLAKYTGLAVLAIAGTSFVSSGWSEQPKDFGIVAEWNQAIGQLGIEPVFPPEEDIYVGDVYAVITADRRHPEKTARSALLGRSIKLYTVSMAGYLKEVYDAVPIFPATKKRPALDNDIWEHDAKQNIFEAERGRSYLALAAFPAFTIRQDRAAAAGIVGWGSMLAGSRSGSELVEVKIPHVETYGVPSLVASGMLERLCDGELRHVCTDEAIRRHLTHVAGSIVEATVEDPVTKKHSYLVDVELILVNRVYLARAIEQRRVSDAASKRSFGASYGSDTVPASAPDEKVPDAATSEERRKALIAYHEARIKQLSNAAHPAGMIGVGSYWDNSLSLNRTFQRPVVFGYRAVRKKFAYDLDKIMSAPDTP